LPIPVFIGKVNRRLTNRITSLFAGKIRPFAIVEHRGRRTGETYRTPIMAFPFEGGFDIALTYCPETDWVRNVMAEGRCTLEYRRRRIELTGPRLFETAPESARLPLLIRLALSLIHVNDFLRIYDVEPDSLVAEQGARNGEMESGDGIAARASTVPANEQRSLALQLVPLCRFGMTSIDN
jgi:deazaflavin-dependent oxidoreductase (nitroreductase family)